MNDSAILYGTTKDPKEAKKKKKNLEKEQTSHLFQNMLQNVSN